MKYGIFMVVEFSGKNNDIYIQVPERRVAGLRLIVSLERTLENTL